jgi:uncharacterized protein YbcI
MTTEFAPSTQPRGAIDSESRGRLASAISNTVVRVFADYVGRGPTRARTVIHGTIITVVLQDTLTKAEHRLIERGQTDTVIDTRRAFQQTMRDELIGAIEDLCGSRVIAFLSDHQAEPDFAVENFILESPPSVLGSD